MHVLTISDYGEVLAGYRWLPVEIEDTKSFSLIKNTLLSLGGHSYAAHINRGEASLGWLPEADMEDGAEYRYPSIATLLASSVREDWIGVFQIGDKFWFGGALKGHPLPRTDKVFTVYEDAFQEVIDTVEAGNFSKIYLPHSLRPEDEELDNGLVDGSEISIVLDSEQSPLYPKLIHQSIQSKISETIVINRGKIRKWGYWGVIVLTLSIVGTGFYFINLSDDPKSAVELQRERILAQQEHAKQRAADNAWAEFHKQWSVAVPVNHYFNECAGNLLLMLRGAEGWSASAPYCDTSNAVVTFKRETGNTTAFSELEEMGFVAEFITPDTYALSFTLDTQAVEGRDALADRQATLRALGDEVGLYFSNLASGGERNLPTKSEMRRDEVYASMQLSLSGIFDIDGSLGLLSDIPGIVPKSLSYNMDDDVWALDVEFYYEK